uniref:PWWP domain containing 2B n=1 Tax=Vombatus ursinus TaxID=29139 RepID=A0A4X2KXK8_VOMUR
MTPCCFSRRASGGSFWGSWSRQAGHQGPACGCRRLVLTSCPSLPSCRSGLFGLPSSLPKRDAPLSDSCSRWAPREDKGDAQAPETVLPPLPPPEKPLEPAPPLVPPLPAGSAPPFPPYFEGAPFPHPLWLRHTYNQWVPQPPPRTIKRTKRRLSRNRDPGRLIMSTIRLRPRRVLCEKCKNTLNPEESSPSQPSAKPRRRLSAPDKEPKRAEELDCEMRRSKREKSAGELVPRSPVIKISYSTPQGKGEVVKIPSRVHGSLKPFCPQQGLQNGGQDQEARDPGSGDRLAGGQPASIPKLKLTRPVPSGEAPPPKIRLNGSGGGQSVSIYKAELIDELGDLQGGRESHASSAFYADRSSRRQRRLAELSSGSSGEEDDFGGFPPAKDGRDNLAFLMNYKRKADSSSLSVCSNDSLDGSSSDTASPDGCDFLPGDDASVSSSSREERKTVPPLTVRLHTQSVARCVTEDGRTVSVGDIVKHRPRVRPSQRPTILPWTLGEAVTERAPLGARVPGPLPFVLDLLVCFQSFGSGGQWRAEHPSGLEAWPCLSSCVRAGHLTGVGLPHSSCQ